MDSKILIKPLSLWPEYSMGGEADFAKKWGSGCTQLCTPKLSFKGDAPRMHPNYFSFSWLRFARFCRMKNPGTVAAPGFSWNINAC